MRHLIHFTWGIILSILPHLSIAGSDPDTTGINSLYELNTNPLTGKRYFGTLKVNTLQVLFSEVPFTLEIFLRNDLSLQFQTGIIFPLESDSFLEQFFRSSGVNSTASPRGIVSYRNSPYNNHGLSFKYEIRKYESSFYYAPQLMYKFCNYDEVVFRVSLDNRTVRQTESKRSSIWGVGLMLGRQTYFMKQATDWYIGAGVRTRHTTATVLKIEDHVSTGESYYPGTEESSTAFYPFVNFGFRLGFVL